MNKRYEITEYVIRWSKRYNKLVKIPLEDKRERIKETYVNGVRTVIDPELKITECTKDFVSSRKGVKKNNGSIKLHPAYKKSIPKNEFKTALWLSEEFGMDIMIDKENTRSRDISYIDLFDGRRWWEEKSPKSLTGVRNRIKTGVEQLADFKNKEIGGVIVNVTDKTLKNTDIKQEALNAINEHSRVNCYVIVRKCDELVVVYKVRHK